ncbi:MAG: asparagine synthase (glutamine-hydrolyzing) [Ruminococcus sp.]|nr:asparagine synthase (glutamine-hydrolyzing) [Ruminococcus sp.]
MCGICGFTGELENREAVLQRMTEVITHRGPDSDGYYTDDYISMGFRRLSIIDLDTGDQPITNEDGNLVLTFNGEIYNYKELRKELEAQGHTFATNSDSEVLVHGFEEWGEDMLPMLRGMFAFAIYNKDNKSIFLARDYFGIKPLHYTMIDDDLCYASEIKSILEHPNFVKVFNDKALDSYLSFQYCPQPMTFFKDVYCLMPGHFMWFKDGMIETQKYFEAKFKPDNNMSEDEAVARIEQVFEDSINAHKIADVPVGCFLSSGVDSSYVSTYFEGQKTFTVGFDFGEKYNEISWAQELSEKIGVEHHSKLISSEEFWAAVPKVQYHMDQPLADPSCVALYFVAKLASEHVKVVLSGEGADELFGGYTCYNDPRVFKLYQKVVPYFMRRAIGWVCSKLPDIKGRDFLLRAVHPLDKRYIGNAYMYDEKQKKALLKDPSIATDPTRQIRRLYTRARRYDDETKMQYVDINTWLIGDILLKADRMSMANSLELRVPFLDKEVYEVASKLPTPLRVNKFNTKYAMRKAAARRLPEEVAEKPKLGFPVPTRVWLRDEHYYNVVKAMFTSPTAQKFFNTDILLEYLDEHFEEKEDNSRRIWTIYVFLVWYQIYFGAVEPEELAPEAKPEDGEAADGEAETQQSEDVPADGTKVFTPVKEGEVAERTESADAPVEAEEIAAEAEQDAEPVEAIESESAEAEAAPEQPVQKRRMTFESADEEEEEERPVLTFTDDIDPDDFFAGLKSKLRDNFEEDNN